MSAILFWFFAALMLGFGCMVVFMRSPVASALSLVVSFLGLAALFVLLNAFFIAVIQVLVYAGAVMVLFLFIIMLLDLKAERLRRVNLVATTGGILVAVIFIWQLILVLGANPAGAQPFPELDPLPALGVERIDDVRMIGAYLFSDFNLPFQVIGVLVLVATIGVVVLSKRELK